MGITAAPEGGISYKRGYFSWGPDSRKILFLKKKKKPMQI
jgi:hypothetical protein